MLILSKLGSLFAKFKTFFQHYFYISLLFFSYEIQRFLMSSSTSNICFCNAISVTVKHVTASRGIEIAIQIMSRS